MRMLASARWEGGQHVWEGGSATDAGAWNDALALPRRPWSPGGADLLLSSFPGGSGNRALFSFRNLHSLSYPCVLIRVLITRGPTGAHLFDSKVSLVTQLPPISG